MILRNFAILKTMTMKKTLALGTVLATVLMASCDREVMNRLQHQNDSLTWVSRQQERTINDLATTINEITQSLDTIAASEREVLSGVDERGMPLTKYSMRLKLEALSLLIKEQHARLDSLGEALDESNETLFQLRTVVNMLTLSLDAKMREIDSLHTVLTYKDISIIRLGDEIHQMADTVKNVRSEMVEQRRTLAEQTTAMGRQDAQLHEVYYIIGPKDKLVEAGVLTKEGGLFKKKKVNFVGVEKSWLTSADMRTLNHIDIPSKNAKILSDVPEASYRMIRGKTSCSLDILDAQKFWSSNNRILVIQTK